MTAAPDEPPCPHTGGGGPPLEFAPLDRDFIADPYPTYAHLRENEPLHQLPSGYWVITRYDDVLTALKDPSLSNAPPAFSILNSERRGENLSAEIVNNIFHLQCPERHEQGRRVVGRAYFQQLKSRPPDLDRIAMSLIESWKGQGEFDVVDDFANPLSAAAICDVLGIDNPDFELLKKLGKNFFYLFNMKTAQRRSKPVERGLLKFRHLLLELIEDRKARPCDDLISALCHLEDPAERMSDEEIADTCMFLFADGVENVNGGVGGGLLALLRHPQQLQQLREDSSLLDAAVDECLRYDAPAQFIIREVAEEIIVGDQLMEPGEILMPVIGSANRDERRFERADCFDIGRSKNPHLSFGRGRHMCLGASLAKAEIKAALGALTQHVDPDRCRLDDLDWSLNVGHRWPKRLKVELSS